jgi:hypothetical protein
MCSLLRNRLCAARRFALGGNRTQGYQDGVDDQDDMRPLMTDDLPCAVLELLGVFRRETGTLLERALNENGSFPGQTFHLTQHFGKWLRLLLGKALSRRDGHRGMCLQPLTELGFVPSRKSCGFFERMFLHHDHQQEEITGADPLKTVTKGDMMCDPRLEGARPQNAASLEPLDRWRVAYDRGNTTRCPAILEKEARGVIKGVGSL